MTLPFTGVEITSSFCIRVRGSTAWVRRTIPRPDRHRPQPGNYPVVWFCHPPLARARDGFRCIIAIVRRLFFPDRLRKRDWADQHIQIG
jgi:hypothetical protein